MTISKFIIKAKSAKMCYNDFVSQNIRNKQNIPINYITFND